MKRQLLSLAALLLAALALLCACAPSQPAAPALETTLEEAGVPLAFSGCAVAEQETLYQTAETAAPQPLRLFAAEGRPAVALSGVEEADVTVRFATPTEGGYRLFEPNTVMPKLDYRAAQQGDTLTLQLRTVYNYVITVATDAGSESFLVTTQME